MSYSKNSSEVFTYFTDNERDLIEKWLKDNNYKWDKPVLCGSCCGFYDEEFFINGIYGEFINDDKNKFIQYAERNNIDCKVDGNSITAKNTGGFFVS